MKFDFTGKVAAITGAARSIGLETAKRFAKTGAKIAMLDLLEKEARESQKLLQDLGAEVELYVGDVTDFEGMKTTFKAINDRFGSVDICIAAAGVVSITPFLETPPAEIARVMNINTYGVMAPTMAALPYMMEQKSGKMVIVSSIAGKNGGGFNGNTFYGASKGAAIAYTKGLAREAAPYNINVNSVCPGPVETVMFASCTPENRSRILAGSMFDRINEPDDIANSIIFLCSEYARNMTSIIHTVDCGITKGN